MGFVQEQTYISTKDTIHLLQIIFSIKPTVQRKNCYAMKLKLKNCIQIEYFVKKEKSLFVFQIWEKYYVFIW